MKSKVNSKRYTFSGRDAIFLSEAGDRGGNNTFWLAFYPAEPFTASVDFLAVVLLWKNTPGHTDSTSALYPNFFRHNALNASNCFAVGTRRRTALLPFTAKYGPASV